MKNILTVFAVFALTATANASYLYWTVQDSYTMENTGAKYTYNPDKVGSASEGNFAYGTIHVVDNNVDTAITSGVLGPDGTAITGNTTPGMYVIDISSYGESAAYYVEVIAYNSSWEASQVGTTGTLTYNDLVSSGAVTTSESLVPVDPVAVRNTWHGAGANAPEPTSAMLMLLGVAGLALRRKQRKIA